MVLFCLTMSVYGQTAQSKTSSQNTTELQNENLLLTIENQRFVEENGVVRCYSVEHNTIRKQNNNTIRGQQNFEDWIAPLVEEHKNLVASGRFRPVTYRIPVIFHVISSGPGNDTYLSQAQIQAQLDQLNLDFRNLAGSSNPAAADSQIEFVLVEEDPNGNALTEIGINRVSRPNENAITRTTFENTIKPNSIWDRTKYANIWTGNLSNSLLGYAQFPEGSTLPGMPTGNENNQTDGVVVLHSSVGSVANPFPGGGVYASGRTLTHEIGHWIGLRHVWGDPDTQAGENGCDVDDFCNDTPNSQSATSGCPNNKDTCSGGGNDPVENYMDYSHDTCMDTFTADQVARMVVVMQNSPGRSELPTSPALPTEVPTISFQAGPANSNVIEGSECNYTDITVPLSISEAPSANASVNFTVDASSIATAGEDFDLLTNSVNFPSGSTASRNITLRIYNDNALEGDETAIITFTVNANGGDAVAGSNTLNFTIAEDDTDPLTSGPLNAIFSDDFENGLSQWTVSGNGTTNFAIGNRAAAGSQYFNFPASGEGSNASNFAFVNDDTCNCTMDAERIAMSNALALTAGVTYTIAFDYVFDDRYAGDTDKARIEISTDNGSTWPIGADLTKTSDSASQTEMPWISTSFTYTPQSNDNTSISFIYNDGGGWAQGLMIDNFSISAPGPVAVQTALNTTTPDALSLANTTVYAYDESSTNIMTSITNNNSFDYGCLNVSVSREGTTAQAYDGSTTPNLVMDKTFTITPTSTTSTGDTTVDFYVTANELTGWETATGLSRNNLVAYRTDGDETAAITVSTFGSDFKLSANFSGLSGTYYFGPQGAFAKINLAAKVYLQGAGVTGGLMADGLRTNSVIPTTSPYSDNLTANSTVFNTTGDNAIVDWVWVELRDKTDNTAVLASTSAFVQRDGDVVAADGTSVVAFKGLTADNYYVVINHRNHLGVMSAATIALSKTATTVDFTNGSVTTYGTNAQADLGNGVMALWGGDINGNGSVRYLGFGNDTNVLKSTVLNDAGNTNDSNLYQFTGYDNADVNLNGRVRYLGFGNDTNIIKNIILNNPNNTNNSNIFTITEQLP